MLNKQILRILTLTAVIVGIQAATAFAQHPCDNYPVTVCNIQSSFSSWTVQDNNSAATQQIGEPPPYQPWINHKTLWYSWTAPTSGTIVSNTRYTNGNNTFVLDTELAVYRSTGGGTFAGLLLLDQSDDWTAGSAANCYQNLVLLPPDELSPSSCVLLPVTAGVTYFFQVDGYGGTSGPFFLNLYYLAPTAADVSVSGRVTDSNGKGISKTIISLTDINGNVRKVMTSSFGYYRIHGVTTGQSYTLQATNRRYQFANNPRILNVVDTMTEENFTVFEN